MAVLVVVSGGAVAAPGQELGGEPSPCRQSTCRRWTRSRRKRPGRSAGLPRSPSLGPPFAPTQLPLLLSVLKQTKIWLRFFCSGPISNGFRKSLFEAPWKMEVIGESFGDGNAGLEGQHKQDSSMWNAGATRSTQLHYAVELWDMSEVENWLRSRQLARFAANFKENDVVGKVMHMPFPLCRTVPSSTWQRQVVSAQLPCLACPAASHFFIFIVEAWFPPWVVVGFHL